jgi:hypothetical protein
MIDTAKAKWLRDLAVRRSRAEGRSGYNVETKGFFRRITQYERGRLHIEYLSPRVPDAASQNRAAFCLYNFGPLQRREGSKRCLGRYPNNRLDLQAGRLGTVSDRLSRKCLIITAAGSVSVLLCLFGSFSTSMTLLAVNAR